MSDPTANSPTTAAPLKPHCLSIDLEVSGPTQWIVKLAAARRDSGESPHFDGGDPSGARGRLDGLAEGCCFVPGHHLIEFDRPLTAAVPALRLLTLPAVDTLWLNPLAFPYRPDHQLVKHCRDGGLERGRLNDPLLDAQQTLEVFANQ
ncbi:MAG: hypothetical protein H6942_12060 [Candidatus Accumulibacter sp.]|uniref:hypothetical protein n=1 Tax=Accumulibacter sp. TaxID=2053492 RepID=UPI0025F460E9|nr:hypothetical protein [Accumulibacter sp.]MCP5249247.1 hypothetical protein [Accumulibacter sp.]